MTRERLIKILNQEMDDTYFCGKAADRILAALAKEREGEVTVGRVVCKNWPDNNDPVIEMRKGLPKQNGDIIFRPAKGGD